MQRPREGNKLLRAAEIKSWLRAEDQAQRRRGQEKKSLREGSEDLTERMYHRKETESRGSSEKR